MVGFFLPIYIPRALNTGTCIQQGDLFYSAGLHRNHVLATANTGKNRERFWKKCRWMDRKCRNKQERSLAVSVACMAIYWPTPGFKGRTFKLYVLTRWDFNYKAAQSCIFGLLTTCPHGLIFTWGCSGLCPWLCGMMTCEVTNLEIEWSLCSALM